LQEKKGGNAMDFDQIACTIIANAGDSKGDSFAAINAAEEGDFDEAEALLKSSEEKLTLAHEAHSQVLFAAANGELPELNFLLVHASNHLSISEATKDFADVIVRMYKKGVK
jgi:PTS system cellobiose-specific IIA component